MGCDAEYGMSKLLREVVEKDARIAELTAEVAFLREALTAIEIAGTLPLTSEYVADIARNALKDGV